MTLDEAARFEGFLEETMKRAGIAFSARAGRLDDLWAELRNVYLVRTYLRTGFRRFELAKARVKDIHHERGEFWTVGKNNVKDYVPLAKNALAMIDRWIALKSAAGEDVDGDAFLFESPQGGPLSFATIRLAWKAALVGAGLPTRFGVHTARHTAGLIVLATTGSLEKTQRFLRHRSIRTTQKFYTHVDAEQLRRELGAAAAWQ